MRFVFVLHALHDSNPLLTCGQF